jgi:ribosome-binding protein aMBF1 (putative translation factor)
MIKNERQYRITKAQAKKFRKAVQDFTKSPQRVVHPVLRKAQVDALRSQLTDLQRELTAYERLKSGKQKVIALGSLEQLPQTLIQARIAGGLSQEELAAKLGLKPQHVQRYVATEYQSASLERVTEVARALGVKLRHPVEVRLAS